MLRSNDQRPFFNPLLKNPLASIRRIGFVCARMMNMTMTPTQALPLRTLGGQPGVAPGRKRAQGMIRQKHKSVSFRLQVPRRVFDTPQG